MFVEILTKWKRKLKKFLKKIRKSINMTIEENLVRNITEMLVQVLIECISLLEYARTSIQCYLSCASDLSTSSTISKRKKWRMRL